MSSQVKTLQQRRAEHALSWIRKAEEKFREENNRKKFVSYAENAPASVLINGLGQAAATLCAQAKGDPNDPHMAVYEALQNWLCGSDEAAPYKSYQENKGLLIAITKEDRNSYLHAQAEALAYLEWYKKLAVAFLKEDSKKEKSS
jgi:CRISPR-associated protein Cmr5